MTANNIISESLKILVFRTDIDTSQKAFLVQNKLQQVDSVYRVDIDLEDSENVLRVECHPDCRPEDIEKQVEGLGFACSEFTDY